MSERNSWQEFFDGHAPVYMENVFTKNTVEEVDFLIEELGLSPGSAVLDVGCGTGRHSIELARRGLKMTGVDLSEGMLKQARAAASEAGVEVEWIQSDVSERLPPGPFDAALCLCEGAFGLLGAGDSPYDHESRILGNIAGSLRTGSLFVLTALNGLAAARRATPEDVQEGRFDPATLVALLEMEYDAPGGPQKASLQERAFTPSELVLLLRSAGFDVEHVWGGTAGNWGRRAVELDEMEVMVVGRRRGDAA